MHRIDSSTAATSLPTPKAAGTAGYFVDGDPTSGVAGTVVTADFLNATQEELLSVLTAAGITPSKTVRNQLLLALGTLYGATAFTNGSKYYHKIASSGLVVQCGIGATVTGNGDEVTFAQPFTQGFKALQINEASASGWTTGSVTVFGWGGSTTPLSSFKVYCKVYYPPNFANGTGGVFTHSGGVAYSWVAIGI